MVQSITKTVDMMQAELEQEHSLGAGGEYDSCVGEVHCNADGHINELLLRLLIYARACRSGSWAGSSQGWLNGSYNDINAMHDVIHEPAGNANISIWWYKRRKEVLQELKQNPEGKLLAALLSMQLGSK